MSGYCSLWTTVIFWSIFVFTYCLATFLHCNATASNRVALLCNEQREKCFLFAQRYALGLKLINTHTSECLCAVEETEIETKAERSKERHKDAILPSQNYADLAPPPCLTHHRPGLPLAVSQKKWLKRSLVLKLLSMIAE